MNSQKLPLNDIPKFANAKLGTWWSNGHSAYQLRRLTDPRNPLEGRRYLLNPNTKKRACLFKVNPDTWTPIDD